MKKPARKNAVERRRRCIPAAVTIAGFTVIASVGSVFAQSSQPVLTFTRHGGRVKDVAYSPDRKRIASGGEDRVVRVWGAAGSDGIVRVWNLTPRP